MPLGFTHTSTRKEREDKLLLRLGKLKHPYFLCVFNEPFNVHFSITQHYNVLTDAEKQKLLRKFLLKLMKNCFQELWVVVIDDAEYCDSESLDIFDVFTKKDMIFFVLSIGRKLSTDFPVYFNFLHRGKVLIYLFSSAIKINVFCLFYIFSTERNGTFRNFFKKCSHDMNISF